MKNNKLYFVVVLMAIGYGGYLLGQSGKAAAAREDATAASGAQFGGKPSTDVSYQETESAPAGIPPTDVATAEFPKGRWNLPSSGGYLIPAIEYTGTTTCLVGDSERKPTPCRIENGNLVIEYKKKIEQIMLGWQDVRQIESQVTVIFTPKDQGAILEAEVKNKATDLTTKKDCSPKPQFITYTRVWSG